MSNGENQGSTFVGNLVLVVIGFLLTGVVGTCLSRSYIKEDKRAEKRYAVIDSVNRATALSIAGVHEGWGMFAYVQSENDISNRKTFWNSTNRQWRGAYRKLERDLQIHFHESNLDSLFQEIVRLRVQTGNHLHNLLETKPDTVSLEEWRSDSIRHLELLQMSVTRLDSLFELWGEAAVSALGDD